MTTPPPPVGQVTEAVYARLPEVYRTADRVAPPAGSYPLLRYLAAQLDGVAGDLAAFYTRVNYAGPGEGWPPGGTSDLVDPATADPGWLRWLGQLVGVRLDPYVTGQAARDAVAGASSGWRAGTVRAIADAARSALTGTRYVRVVPHSTDAGPGGPWDVLLVTRLTETPDLAAVLNAVVTKRAKPAGVKLWHLAYDASWAQIEAAFPTWADIAAAGAWRVVEEAGAPAGG